MNYWLLNYYLLSIAIFIILPSHWGKLKLKRDKILTIAFLVLFLVIMLFDSFYPKAKRTVWEGRIIIISLVILLFMIFISVAEFISLKKPSTTNKKIIFIAVIIPIIISILAASFVAWHYYTIYLPSLRE
jgi:hypothetical protein